MENGVSYPQGAQSSTGAEHKEHTAHASEDTNADQMLLLKGDKQAKHDADAGSNTGKSDGGKTCAKAFVHCGILNTILKATSLELRR